MSRVRRRTAERSGLMLEAAVVAADRFGALIDGMDGTHPHAIASWSIGEVAAHVSHVFGGDAMLLDAGPESAGVPIQDGFTVKTVARLNATMLEADPERDTHRLAERIRTGARRLADSASAYPAEEHVPWVGGVELTASSIVGHALGEALIHGFDIARAAGLPWPIDAREALLILEGFWFPLVASLPPRFFEGSGAAAFSCDVLLRGGRTTRFVFDDGRLRVEDPSGTRAGCLLSAEPVAFLLVAYGRLGPFRPFLQGRLISRGRRPWAARTLLRVLRTP